MIIFPSDDLSEASWSSSELFMYLYITYKGVH